MNTIVLLFLYQSFRLVTFIFSRIFSLRLWRTFLRNILYNLAPALEAIKTRLGALLKLVTDWYIIGRENAWTVVAVNNQCTDCFERKQ